MGGEESTAINEAFESFDKDHNKRISMPEFEQVFKKNGIELSRVKCELAFSLLDRNGNGFISKKEFVPLYTYVCDLKQRNQTFEYYDFIAHMADCNGDSLFNKKEIVAVADILKVKAPEDDS